MHEDHLSCNHCGRTGMRRVARAGFLQTTIFPKFGRFPWECLHCRKISLLAVRGERKRRRRPEPVHG